MSGKNTPGAIMHFILSIDYLPFERTAYSHFMISNIQ